MHDIVQSLGEYPWDGAGARASGAQRLLQSRDVQQFIGVNRFADVLWFNKESFDELLHDMRSSPRSKSWPSPPPQPPTRSSSASTPATTSSRGSTPRRKSPAIASPISWRRCSRNGGRGRDACNNPSSQTAKLPQKRLPCARGSIMYFGQGTGGQPTAGIFRWVVTCNGGHVAGLSSHIV